MTPAQRNLLCYVATSGGRVSAERIRALFGWRTDYPIRIHVEELRHELQDHVSIRFTCGMVLLGPVDGNLDVAPLMVRLSFNRLFRYRRAARVHDRADAAVQFVLKHLRDRAACELVEAYAGMGRQTLYQWRYRGHGNPGIRTVRRVLNVLGFDLAIVPRVEEDEGQIDLSEMDARRARRLEEDDGRVIARIEKLREMVR